MSGRVTSAQHAVPVLSVDVVNAGAFRLDGVWIKIRVSGEELDICRLATVGSPRHLAVDASAQERGECMLRDTPTGPVEALVWEVISVEAVVAGKSMGGVEDTSSDSKRNESVRGVP